MGRIALLGTGSSGRSIWLTRRVPYRPIRPPAGFGVEHSAICNLRACCRICHVAADAVISPNHDICRRLRRVRGGGGLARRTVPRSEAARSGARIYSGVLFDRWTARHGRLLSRGSLCRRATRDPWSPCAVAIHAHLRGYPSSSADHHPSLPARIARMGAQKGRGHVETAQHRASCSLRSTGRQLWLRP